jgi:hypothetical protein
MVMNLVGLNIKNYCAGKGQLQFNSQLELVSEELVGELVS